MYLFCVKAVAAAGLKWNDQSCSEYRYPLCQTGIGNKAVANLDIHFVRQE